MICLCHYILMRNGIAFQKIPFHPEGQMALTSTRGSLVIWGSPTIQHVSRNRNNEDYQKEGA